MSLEIVQYANPEDVTNSAGRKVNLLEDVDTIPVDQTTSIKQTINQIYTMFVSHAIKHARQQAVSVPESKYGVYDTFRELLKSEFKTNSIILKDEEGVVTGMKIYSVNSSGFNYFELNGSNDITTINISEKEEKSIQSLNGDASIIDKKIYQSIEGSNVSVSYDHTCAGLEYSTRKNTDASNRWDTNEQIKKQAQRIFEETGININRLMDFMKEPSNLKYRIVLNFITTEKSVTHSKSSSNTLVSVYLIRRDKSIMSDIKTLLDEYTDEIKADPKHSNEQRINTIYAIIDGGSSDYVSMLNLEQFRSFLYNNDVGCVPIPVQMRRYTEDSWGIGPDIDDYITTAPHTVKGIYIELSPTKRIEFEGAQYKEYIYLRIPRSIHITGDVQDEDFGIKNFNVFLQWIHLMTKKFQFISHDSAIQRDYENSIFPKFYEIYNNPQFILAFQYFAEKLVTYSKLLWKYYVANKRTTPGSEVYCSIDEFPECLMYRHGTHNMIFAIQQEFYYIRNVKKNYKFFVTEEYIMSEFMIKKVLPVFLGEALKYNEYDFKNKCTHGNVFEMIVACDTSKTIKYVSKQISDQPLY
jgi:hypothetical protein